ncbi:MAG: LysR family transcriptional regulator [Pleomorphochaeta sp.]
MTLRHLKIFIAVCKYKSTVEASKQLHIAQPSISFAIKEVENYYGIKLFDRISRKLILTEDGQIFLYQATDIINKVNNLEYSMKDSDKKKVLNLGCSASIAIFILPYIITKFNEENLSVKINITIRDSKTLKNLILENSIDIALIETPIFDSSIISTNFYKDSLLLYISKLNPLAKKNNIVLKDLLDQNIILREKHSAVRALIDSAFILNNINIKIENDSTSTQAILSLVENNLGVSILPSLWKDSLHNNTNIVTKEIMGVSLRREYSIIQHKNKNITNAINQLISICKTITY